MSSFSNKGIDTSSTATTIFHAIIVYILIVVVFIFFPYRLKYLYDGLSRPIPHWQVVMFIMLLIIAILQLVDAIMYASGHNSHLGQEVMADNLIRTYTEIDGSFFTRVLALRYLYLLCDLLQTLVFTIAILQSARYSPRDQRMFYRILRVEYTSLGILAIWDLFYNFLWPYVGQYYARLLTNYEQFLAFEAILLLTVSTRVIHVVLTIILLAASIDLEMQSNPAREISKVRTISYERYISASYERII